MRVLRTALPALAAALVVAGSPAVRAAEPAIPAKVVLADQQDAWSIGRHLSLLEDKQGTWTLDDVRARAPLFTPSGRDIPSLGYTDSYYWARFTLQNPTARPKDVWLEMQPAWLQFIDLYVVHADGSVETQRGGLRQPSVLQPIPHRHYLFPLTVAANAEDTAWVRVRARNMQLDFTAWRPVSFLRAERQAQLLYGLFFGWLAVMAAYNLFLFVAARMKAYLYCSLYLVATIFQQLSFRGFTTELFPSTAPLWILYGNVIPGVAFLFALEFGKAFLDLKRHAPLMERAMVVLQGASVVVIALPFVVRGAFNSAFTAVVGGLVATVSLVAGALVYRRGYRPARYYLVGWALLQGGGLVHILGQFSVLPLEPFAVRHSVQLGAAADALMLSLALADQINVMRDEKLLAQAEALAAQRALNERLDLRVRERTDALEKALQSMRDFYHFIAHELRTPLTALRAHVRFLSQGMRCEPPTAEQRAHLEVVDRNAERMLHLSRQLLELARAEARLAPPSSAPTALRSLVAECLQDLAALFAPEVQLVIDVDPALEVTVDPEYLATILVNVLSNAARFTRAGEVRVVASTAGEELELQVIDTGIGIAEGQIPATFKPFGQLGLAGEGRREGTGLGLYICQQLLEKLHGRLQLQSRQGEGTTVTIRLPLVQPQPLDRASTEPQRA